MSSLTAWDSRCFSIRSISISSKPHSKIEVFQIPSSSSFSLISARVKKSSFSSSESIEENITLQMNVQNSYKTMKNPMLVWLKNHIFRILLSVSRLYIYHMNGEGKLDWNLTHYVRYTTLHYTTLQLQLHYTTTTTALHHTTSSSCGWGDRCNLWNHSKKHNSNHLTAAPYCQVQSSWFHAAFMSLQFATWLTNNTSLWWQSLNPKMQDEGGFVAPSASFFIEGFEGQAVNTCKIVPHQQLGMECTQK